MKTHYSKTRLALLSVLFLTLLFGKIALAETTLVFDNMWIAEAPPVSKVLAAYATIKNTGGGDQKLVSATSSDFGSIEFHRTVEKKGMASMQHQPFLLIPAGGSLALKPGDYHMMLFKPSRKLRAGDTSSFQFKLENGELIKATAVVKKASAENTHQHYHH